MARTNALNGDLQFSSNLPVSGVNVGANSALIVTTSSGVSESTSALTDGQIVIGSTSATPTAATITAGSGITVTNGAGSITIAASGGAAANGLLNVQRLTTTGTYTATAGTVSCVVMAVAGGGGGGAVVASSGGTPKSASGSGGGGGAFGQKYYAVAPTGTAYVIGAGGAGGAAGTNFGAAGSETTFNAGDMNLLGGGGGGYMNSRAADSTEFGFTTANEGGSPDAADNSDITSNGDTGSLGVVIVKAVGFTEFMGPGLGGSSMLGKGALAPKQTANSGTGSPGNNAIGYGGGGSGAFYSTNGTAATAAAGGNGAPGIIIVYEYGA